MVTPDGKVFNRKGREMRGAVRSDGYAQVMVRIDGKPKFFFAHRIIAAAYCEGYAPELQVNHKNGIKTDNRAANLEWVTPKKNIGHAIENGLMDTRGEAHGRSKIKDDDVIEIVAMRRAGAKVREVAARFKIAESRVSAIANGKAWKHIARDPSNDEADEVECVAEKNIATLQQTKKLRGAKANRRGAIE